MASPPAITAIVEEDTKGPTRQREGKQTKRCKRNDGGGVVHEEQLAPLAPELRTWPWWSFAALWVAINVNPATFSITASLFASGFTFVEVIASIIFGTLVTNVALLANSHAGAKYGIPFAVYARSAFGCEGAKFAAASRGVIAVLWLSFQMWQGAYAFIMGLNALVPGANTWINLWPPNILSLGQLLSFAGVAIIHAALVIYGLFRFSKVPMFVLAAICSIGLIGLWIWSIQNLGVVNFNKAANDLLRSSNAQPIDRDNPGWVILVVLKGTNVIVSNWSTMILNMSDISRYAKTQRAQMIGQTVGINLSMLVTALAGVAGSIASVHVGAPAPVWQIVELFVYWQPAWAFVGGLLVLIAVINVNVYANIIPPAFDFYNLAPQHLGFRVCALFSIAVAFAACPYALFTTASNFAFRFLAGYGVVTGALFGVMVTHYYAVQRTNLNMSTLYPPDYLDEDPAEEPDASTVHMTSPIPCYHVCTTGHCWQAIVALLCGILLPGIGWIMSFIPSATKSSYFAVFSIFDDVSWLLSATISSLVYLACSWRHIKLCGKWKTQQEEDGI